MASVQPMDDGHRRDFSQLSTWIAGIHEALRLHMVSTIFSLLSDAIFAFIFKYKGTTLIPSYGRSPAAVLAMAAGRTLHCLHPSLGLLFPFSVILECYAQELRVSESAIHCFWHFRH